MTAGNKTFDGRVVVVGYGTIGRCALPMLRALFGLPLERFLVIDQADHSDLLADEIAGGLRFQTHTITPDNLAKVLGAAARAGDLLLNLSVGIESLALADWCHHNGVIYLDTALEPWEGTVDDSHKPAAERTEYAFHQTARGQARASWRTDGPTAVITHGANPGLVSHFAKAALVDLARSRKPEIAVPDSRAGWARLARDLGVKVIHISERDTQVTGKPKEPGEFVNTWSIPGFVEEAMMPVEIGWGSHEKTLPPGARRQTEGPCNAIYVERPAAQVLLRSWVPLGGQILGLALPHSESVTISEYLTLEEGGQVVYRPTVAFVYMPCDGAMASLHETMMNGWQMQPRERILFDEITTGRDELGVLLLGDGPSGWWYGSQLDIEEARRLAPGSNPTALQVAAGVVSAALWAARNPNRGFCEPEDLPHEEILVAARPYLGPVASLPTDWTPFRQRKQLFDEPRLDPADPWQFTNFTL
ncbi:MAG: saccharopine dehydrogenase C-terminal domain-containing protein [Pseudomonadota bacterium]